MNSLTELILVRHGETEWNLSGFIQGCTDIPLSSNGRLQAVEVSESLTNSFDVIYTSPLQRALDTAKAISNGKFPIIIDDKFREVPFGNWEGKRFEDLTDENYKKFCRGEDGLPIGDTGKSVRYWEEKNAEVLLNICHENEGKRIVVVSHGAWIKCAILGLLKLEPKAYHNIKLGNTGVSRVKFPYGYPILENFNITSHTSLGDRSKTG
ncbi:phosphoglycerate mutase, putative [Entamoeba invadens IP1]|uniref:Phosphoglycerate mutase, putative n=1 Tax=Entamoeba invadens IP1 TaxID=370355 RepID=L7FL70_ENTIV|nr:phosphoglycerate mutase, putative [Entamoeba invadens IP1]ELP87662.1 phosphoglycerate mutase, putative [Entamoeba invadens IP1]|eukprot:XP_004254433.1 phosphoglycerate mutase, putative [Entamoeba invadens IP1]